jgi:hypothetical protein
MGEGSAGIHGHGHENDFGDLVIRGPGLFSLLNVAVNALRAAGDVGAGYGNQLLHFNGQFPFFKNFLIESDK